MKKLMTGVAAVTVALAAWGGIAGAVVSYDLDSGTGFVGRGDVIDHPALGKTALVTDPVVTFGSEGHWAQDCGRDRKVGKEMVHDTHTFRRGKEAVTVTVTTETRKAKGNDNITGYLLTGTSSEGTFPEAPATGELCPNGGGWAAEGDPYWVETSGGSLVFSTSTSSGAWTWDETLAAWSPVV